MQLILIKAESCQSHSEYQLLMDRAPLDINPSSLAVVRDFTNNEFDPQSWWS